jgi:hypothetical protein
MKKNKLFLALLAMLFAPCFDSSVYARQLKTSKAFNIFGINFRLMDKQEVEDNVLFIISGLALSGKIAYDISWHGEYASRVSNCYNQLTRCIEINNIKTVDNSALVAIASKTFKKEVMFLEQSLYNSYGSWICPWNWTSGQKLIFNQIQVVSILTTYAELNALADDVTGADVLRNARQIFVHISMFPCVECYQKMVRQIAFIKDKKYTNCPEQELLSQMLEKLELFAELLSEQPEYSQELQTMRTHKMLEANANR